MDELRRLLALLFVCLTSLPTAQALDAGATLLSTTLPDVPATLPGGTRSPQTTSPDEIPAQLASRLDPLETMRAWAESRDAAAFAQTQLFPRGLDDEMSENGVTLKFAHPTDDVNGDGVDDLYLNEWDLSTLGSRVQAVSGADGALLWEQDNFQYYPFYLIPSFPWPLAIRPGSPFPQPFTNFAVVSDVNGDNVRDVATLGYTIEFIPLDPFGCNWLIPLAGAYRLLNGKTGDLVWTEPYSGLILWELCGDPLIWHYQNVPGGFYAVDTPNGPRLLTKHNTVNYNIVFDPSAYVTGQAQWWVENEPVIEQLYFIDAKTGLHAWERNLLPTENPSHAVFSYVTGFADLGATPAPDVVLDQWFVSVPQYSERRNPITGDPMYNYGRGMSVLTLNGDDGKNLWQSLIFEDPPVRANLPVEEAYPVMVWEQAQVLPDLTGDGTAEIVALYLTADSTSPSTVNGIFRTNFAPLNGKDGQKLWPVDQKYIGWGFAAAMGPPGTTAPYLAIATTDVPTAPPPGGRFPPKDIHMAVLHIKDGSPAWSLSQRYSQDSYVVWHMTLDQYLHALAPYDWNHDGLRDLVTPSQYIKPGGANQTVLSTATHTYQIYSGADGSLLQTFTAWGSLGQVVLCEEWSPTLTVVTGHSRRFDLTRYNGETGDEVWRQPVFNDPRLRPATAGVDLLFFGARCLPSQERNLVNLNVWTFAIGRGYGGHEVHALYGFQQPLNGLLDWILPALEGQPPLVPSFYRAPDVGKGFAIPTWALYALGPIVPGAAAGIALSFGVRTRGGGR